LHSIAISSRALESVSLFPLSVSLFPASIRSVSYYRASEAAAASCHNSMAFLTKGGLSLSLSLSLCACLAALARSRSPEDQKAHAFYACEDAELEVADRRKYRPKQSHASAVKCTRVRLLPPPRLARTRYQRSSASVRTYVRLNAPAWLMWRTEAIT